MKGGFCLYMVNTIDKNFIGEGMDDNLIIRVDKKLKEDFKEAAEKLNPSLPSNRAVSTVIRELMIKYIEDFQVKQGKK
jgi:hypothetical protein